jgi:hypothetical protein
MSSLEHVSLQYMFDDDDDCDCLAENLENISTYFPYARSLFLRYEIPKVRNEALFSYPLM